MSRHAAPNIFRRQLRAYSGVLGVLLHHEIHSLVELRSGHGEPDDVVLAGKLHELLEQSLDQVRLSSRTLGGGPSSRARNVAGRKRGRDSAKGVGQSPGRNRHWQVTPRVVVASLRAARSSEPSQKSGGQRRRMQHKGSRGPGIFCDARRTEDSRRELMVGRELHGPMADRRIGNDGAQTRCARR